MHLVCFAQDVSLDVSMNKSVEFTALSSTSQSSEQVLAQINRPIGSAIGLPGAWYCDETLARLESERLFARTWVCAGFAHELSAVGDVVPVDVAGFPVIFARGRDQAIHAFHNVCPHRGSRLVCEKQGARSAIKCPYHGWAFDLNGNLKSTPHWGGHRQHLHPDFDASCHGLRAIRCEQWHDWLFVNIDGEAPPLTEYMAPFSNHVAEYSLESLVHHSTAPYDLRGNWKLVQENFLEVIHLPPIHRRLNEYAPFQDHVVVVDDVCIGTVIEQGLPANWSKDPLPRFPGVSATAQNAKNLALFPNFKLIIGPDHCCSMVELPAGAQATRQRWDFYFLGEGATASRFSEARNSIIDFFVETNEEDMLAIEELHAGRSSPAFTGGVFSEVWEPAVHQFQKLVAAHMCRPS